MKAWELREKATQASLFLQHRDAVRRLRIKRQIRSMGFDVPEVVKADIGALRTLRRNLQNSQPRRRVLP